MISNVYTWNHGHLSRLLTSNNNYYNTHACVLYYGTYLLYNTHACVTMVFHVLIIDFQTRLVYKYTCICVQVYRCIYTCVHVHIYSAKNALFWYTGLQPSIPKYTIYICVHVCMCIHMSTCVYTPIHIYLCVYVCLFHFQH